MPTSQLQANMKTDKRQAYEDIAVAIAHFGEMDVELQSVSISGGGVATLTYTGTVPSSRKEHLKLT